MSPKQVFLLQILAIAAIALLLDAALLQQMRSRQANDARLETSLQVAALRARIEKEITANLLLLHGAASFIAATGELSPDAFATYAGEAMRGDNLLRNLGAAPDFVMTYVYPEQGNSEILGVDYRDLPGQWEQARLARETGRMVVAGPLQLVQGGVGLVGRAPVYVEQDGQRGFWGIVSAVMDMDRLFKKVGLEELVNLDVALRGVDGKGPRGDVFLGDAGLFAPDARAVTMPVSFPSGSWQIAARPSRGWSPGLASFLPVHAALLLLSLAAVMAAWKSMQHRSALQRSQEGLKEAQRIAHLGSWELRVASGKLWWSDETYKIFGLAKDTFTPTLQGFMDMVHPEDRALVEAVFKQSLQDRTPYSVDHRILKPDGAVRYVQERGHSDYDAAGAPVRSLGTVQDITNRKATEEALRASEEQLRAMSEASYDALIMIDSQDTVLFWSKAATRMFGWTREEAMGSKLHQLVALVEHQEAANQGLAEFARDGSGMVMNSVMEFQARRKNGELFPVERSVSAFKSGGKYYAVGNLRDITRRKAAEQQLQSYAQRMALASEAGGVGIWEWNVLRNELTWDARMYELYDISRDGFSGLYETWKGRVHPDDIAEAEQGLQTALQSAGDWQSEFRVLLPNGEVRHIHAAARAHANSQGQVERIIGINRDISQRKRAQEQLLHMATTDSLTGISNRRQFMELTSREIEVSRRRGRPLSLILFDADRFKLVNDTYGHGVGDEVLKVIAATARRSLRSVDILGRLGGEEFAAALPETPLIEAVEVAERLRLAIAAATVPDSKGQALQFTVSLGVALLMPGHKDVDSLLRDADEALYEAKATGRNRVVVSSTA